MRVSPRKCPQNKYTTHLTASEYLKVNFCHNSKNTHQSVDAKTIPIIKSLGEKSEKRIKEIKNGLTRMARNVNQIAVTPLKKNFSIFSIIGQSFVPRFQ